MPMRLKALSATVLMVLCLFTSFVFAVDSNAEYVTQLEEQLFSTKYENEDMSQRLSRIEDTIFGMDTPREKESIRVEKLKALLSPEPIEDPLPSENRNSTSNNSLNTYHSSPEDVYDSYNQNDTTNNYEQVPNYSDGEEIEDYPAVSFLESQVFNQTYKGEDVTKRLDRLESNVFNSTKPNKALSERLDDLKMAIVGNSNLGLTMHQQGYNPSDIETYYSSQQNYNQKQFQGPEMNTFQQDPENLNNYNSYQYQPVEPGYDPGQISQQSLMEVTSRLEQELIGQSFPNENLNQRLDRLEMHVFNRTATGYTPESRIERLVAVSAADATSDPHDMQKVQRLRKIQTGLTVGGIIFSLLRGFLF